LRSNCFASRPWGEAVAFVAASAIWTALACYAEVLIRSFLPQFCILFGAGFVASVLMLVSHIMLTPVGMCLYTLDCLGKRAVFMMALQIRSWSVPSFERRFGQACDVDVLDVEN
jgi:hypothetical protein